VILLPFDRERLAQRNALDAEEIQQSASLTPSERPEDALELSDLVGSLAEGRRNGSARR
jgi:hypothetical protein